MNFPSEHTTFTFDELKASEYCIISRKHCMPSYHCCPQAAVHIRNAMRFVKGLKHLCEVPNRPFCKEGVLYHAEFVEEYLLKARHSLTVKAKGKLV